MEDAGVARTDLDRAHESLSGQWHRQDEVAEHVAALGGQRPRAVRCKDQIGRAERPSRGEDRRRGNRPRRLRRRLVPPIERASQSAPDLSRRSPLKVPWPSTGGQGGITRAPVTLTICRARRRTSAYDSSGNGPAPPSWWHGAQWVKTIGATSRVKVTRSAAAGDSGKGVPRLRPSPPAAPSASTTRTAARFMGSPWLSQVRDLATGRRRGDQCGRLVLERGLEGVAEIESGRAWPLAAQLDDAVVDRPR